MKRDNQSARGASSKTRKITLGHIAERAGVSTATVSRVARDESGVSLELRQRVFHAASQLGMNLEERRDSRVIAFLLSNREVLHPFHSAVLVGVEAYCASHDYGVLFLKVKYPYNVPEGDLHIPNILRRRDLFQGAVLAGTNSRNLLNHLTRAGIPFVVLGNNLVGTPSDEQFCNAVYFDDIGGSHEITLYLQSLGHQDIWYIGNSRFPWSVRRKEGYTRAMTEAGIAPHVQDLDLDDPEALGYLATKSILKKGEPVTAIFAEDDATAQGVYRALHERRLRIPEDVSVVGFNDTLEARALHPPLTSVKVFTELVGKSMAELLLNHIAHRTKPPETIMIPTRVAKHESCRQIGPPLQSNLTDSSPSINP